MAVTPLIPAPKRAFRAAPQTVAVPAAHSAEGWARQTRYQRGSSDVAGLEDGLEPTEGRFDSVWFDDKATVVDQIWTVRARRPDPSLQTR